MFININTSARKTSNRKSIPLDNSKEIYQFNMKSYRYVYGLFDRLPISNDALELFFGIVMAEDPTIEVVGFGKMELNQTLKTVFSEYWIKFLRDWFVAYHTTGLHYYELIYLKEFDVYVPDSVDIYQGQAYCLWDRTGDNSQEFKWSFNEDVPRESGTAIYVDPRVYCIATKKMNLREDNLVQWLEYSDCIINNMPFRPQPPPLTVPYATSLSKILEEHLFMKRLTNSVVKTEELKTHLNTIWTVDINYRNEEYQNLLETHGEKKGNKLTLSNSIEFRRFHSLAHTPPPVPIRSVIGGPQQNQDFIFNNPRTASATNIGLYQGGRSFSREDKEKSLENAFAENIGIDTPQIYNGNFEHIIADPIHRPTFVPKESSVPITEQVRHYEQSIALAFGVPLDGAWNSQRLAEGTLRLSMDKFKHRLIAVKKEAETVVNQIYKELLTGDITIIKSFMEEFHGKKLPPDGLEMRFHFKPNFTTDMSIIEKMVQLGVVNPVFARNVVLKNLGLMDEYDASLEGDEMTGAPTERNASPDQDSKRKLLAIEGIVTPEKKRVKKDEPEPRKRKKEETLKTDKKEGTPKNGKKEETLKNGKKEKKQKKDKPKNIKNDE